MSGIAPAVPLAPQVAPTEEGGDDEADDPLILVRAAPPWMISCIFHMVLVIVLGLLSTSAAPVSWAPELDVGGADGVATERPDLDPLGDKTSIDKDEGDATPVDQETIGPSGGQSTLFQTSPAIDGLSAAPDTGALTNEGIGTFDKIHAPSLGVLLTGREPGMKGILLRAYGGSDTTEAAVTAGLGWLARKQHATGTWNLTGPYPDGANVENSPVAMGLALLAYQGAGYTTTSGQRPEFRDVVARGWKALLKKQSPDGSFLKRVPEHHNFYTQAICTLALCELYAMTRDPEYHDRAQRAVDFLVKNQAAAGGWKYEPRRRSDLSVSGWVMMALQSARMGKLNVPAGTLYEFEKFLDSAAKDGGRQYSYEPPRPPTLPITAEGLLCREYLGWAQNDPRLVDGAKWLADNPIDYVNNPNVYYWYYATQVLHHLGGKAWEDWNKVLSVEVPRRQVQHGAESGSWNPTDDTWGINGGRLYTTCLSLYMLEVYYRHLPIYAQKLDLTIPTPAGAKPLESQNTPAK